MSATQNQADFKIEFYSGASTDRNYYFYQATNSQWKNWHQVTKKWPSFQV